MNTKLLRQKILDLAIRGKLTEQKKSDGTTKDLLKQIASNVILSNAKNPGKSKNTPKEIIPLDKTTAPFEIPDNWEWVRLGDVSYIASGSTPSKDCFVDDGVPYLKMYNLRNQQIDFQYKPQFIKREIHEGKLARSRAKPYDVIMNIVGPPLGKIALIPETLPECNFNQAAVLIRAHYETKLMNQYIRFYLMQMDEINSINTKGTAGQENLSLSQTQNMRLPLPPLAEQQRIVTAIENAFAEITEIENNQELLKKHIKQARQKILDLAIRGKLTEQKKSDGTTKDLLESIMAASSECHPERSAAKSKDPAKKKSKTADPKQIIPLDKSEAPFEIPENWEWVKLGDVLNEMQSTSPRGETFKYIDIDSIDNVACRVKSPKIIETKNAPSRASRFTKKGDVLFSMVRPYLKNIAKVIEDDCIASTGFYVCSPKGIVSDYCYYLMISNYVVDGLNQFMKGDNSPSISSKNITDWFIPLPPLAEQQRIVATIEQAFAEFDAME